MWLYWNRNQYPQPGVRIGLLVLSLLFCFLGCISSPIRQLKTRGTVEAITISGNRNLGDSQVRLSDPDDIEEILESVRAIRGIKFIRANFDLQSAQVLTIEIIQKDKASKLVMVSGFMAVPGDDTGVYYDSSKQVQAKLWERLLEHLDQN